MNGTFYGYDLQTSLEECPRRPIDQHLFSIFDSKSTDFGPKFGPT